MKLSPYSGCQRRAELKPSMVSISGMCTSSWHLLWSSTSCGDSGGLSTNRTDFGMLLLLGLACLLDGFVAEHGGAQHLPGRVGIVGCRPVQHAPVVPDDGVTHRPAVAVDLVGSGCAVEQLSQHCATLVEVHADDVVRGGTQHKRFASAAVRPYQRMLVSATLPPARQFLRCRVRGDAAL